jgi:hypothetical protein
MMHAANPLPSPPLIAARRARVRPFVAADIPEVARLHQKAFRIADLPAALSPAWYHDYFTRVFLENPAGPGTLPSLVYEETDGRIAGFVGIAPRRIVIGGRRYRAVVSSQFIVDPACPVGLVAVRLARTYLEGPQDLSIADEANDISRRIWERLGGTTARLYSLYWTRPLRPLRLAGSYVRGKRGVSWLAGAAQPLLGMCDALAVRLPGSPFRQRVPSTTADDLSRFTIVERADDFCEPASLRIEHDDRTFRWLVDRAASRVAGGRLLKATIRSGQQVLGWYICHLDREGFGYVAHLGATPSSIEAVLEQLFFEAWRQGAIAVSGRLDPRFMEAFSDRHCLFHRRGPWVLIHAKRPDIVRAFESGNAWFSPLDGEWSLRFQGGSEVRRWSSS